MALVCFKLHYWYRGYIDCHIDMQVNEVDPGLNRSQMSTLDEELDLHCGAFDSCGLMDQFQ